MLKKTSLLLRSITVSAFLSGQNLVLKLVQCSIRLQFVNIAVKRNKPCLSLLPRVTTS